MATDDKARLLSAIVGERLRLFREERGLRQADIAAAAAASGLKWSRSSIAALEAGTRNLSVEELLLVPFVVVNAGGWEKPIIPAEAKIYLGGQYHLKGSDLGVMVELLTSALQGESEEARKVARLADDVEQDDQELRELGSVPAYSETSDPLDEARHFATYVVWTYLVEQARPEVSRALNSSDRMNTEYLLKVGERLEFSWGSPVKLDEIDFARYIPWVLWGRNAEQERDARTDERGEYATKRSLQAARGHATREMIAEMNAFISGFEPTLREYFTPLEGIWDDAEGLREYAYDLWGKSVQKRADVHFGSAPVPEPDDGPSQIPTDMAVRIATIGAAFRSARVRKGLSVEELSQTSSVRAQYIEGLEHGVVPNRWDEKVLKIYIRQLSRHLDLDPEETEAALEGHEVDLQRNTHRRGKRWMRGR